MKVWVTADEAYPVYMIVSQEHGHFAIELTDDEHQMIERAERDYWRAQKLLKTRYREQAALPREARLK